MNKCKQRHIVLARKGFITEALPETGKKLKFKVTTARNLHLNFDSDLTVLKTKLTYFLFLILITSCNNPSFNEEQNADLKPTSPFEIKSDLFAFSSKMNEGDTLKIIADLSACESFHHEINILTKTKNKILLSTHIEANFIDDRKLILGNVEYIFDESDTLNFENLLKYLNTKGINYDKSNSAFLSIVFNKDTITYYSKSLEDQLENGKYYVLIKRRLYPSEKIYQPTIKPPPPTKDDPLGLSL